MAIQNQGWAYVSGSGTGIPGGDDTQVQYNDDGSLQGSSKFTFDGDDVTVIGDITATAFSGDGSGLTNISSDDVDTTTDTTNTTRYIPFVATATSTDGEILLIDNAISINPSTGVFTVAGSAPSLGIGSAVLVEADMEKIDGITNGTAAASKAVVLDASKNIATIGTVGCGAITSTGASVMGSLNVGGTLACDTSFTIDAVVLNATELGYVDGVTAGTAIASKAVVLDADGDVTGVNNLTASFFKGDGSALTNLPGGGGGGGIFTEIDASSAYTTSSLSIGTSDAPGATLHVSSSGDEALFRVDGLTETEPLIFVSGSGIVGIGTSTPSLAASLDTKLDIYGHLRVGLAGTGYIFANNDNDTAIKFGGAGIPGNDGITFICGNKSMLILDENSGSADSVTLGNDAADLIIVSGSLVVSGSISGSTTIQGASLSVDGAVTAGSLNLAGAAITATAAEINYLDDDDLTAADLTKLAAVQATAGQLDFNYNVTAGTAAASKAVVLDASTNIVGMRNLTSTATIEGVTLTDGTASISAGAVFGVTTINASGLVTGGSLTDGTATITAGAIAGVTTLDASGLASLDGGIDVNGNMTVSTAGAISGGTSYSGSTTIQGASLSVDGAVTGGSLTDGTATITAGAASGFTTIDGSGDLTMGAITMPGFTVDGDGATTCESLALGGADFSISNAGAISGGTSYSGSAGITGSAFNTDGTVSADTVNCSTLTATKSFTANAPASLLSSVFMSVTGSITPAATIVIASPYKRVYLIDVNVLEQSTEVQLPALSAATDGLMITIKSSTTETTNYDITITGSTGTGDKIDNIITAKTLAPRPYVWSTLIADNDNGSWWQIGSGY